MKEGDWEGAAFQMKDSRWHKQTTNRCEELASIVANYKEKRSRINYGSGLLKEEKMDAKMKIASIS